MNPHRSSNNAILSSSVIVDTVTDGLIFLKILKDFKTIDSNNTLSKKFVTRLGTPLWEESLTSDSIYQAGVIPFVNSTNQEVTGLLFVIEKRGNWSYNAITTSYLERLNSIGDIRLLSEREVTALSAYHLFSNNLYCKENSFYKVNERYINDTLAMKQDQYLHLNFSAYEKCCPNHNKEQDESCKEIGMYENAKLMRIGNTFTWIGNSNSSGGIKWNY